MNKKKNYKKRQNRERGKQKTGLRWYGRKEKLSILKEKNKERKDKEKGREGGEKKARGR